MDSNELSILITLKLDEEWLRHQTDEELVQALRDRMDSGLGFRGQILRFRVRAKRKRNIPSAGGDQPAA